MTRSSPPAHLKEKGYEPGTPANSLILPCIPPGTILDRIKLQDCDNASCTNLNILSIFTKVINAQDAEDV
jgi:hypothetical protein